ncbi:Uncharacterised protein [Chlamydia trachomatis]|nr:Uncharacterised protein [Chlamydia trachomatis]
MRGAGDRGCIYQRQCVFATDTVHPAERARRGLMVRITKSIGFFPAGPGLVPRERDNGAQLTLNANCVGEMRGLVYLCGELCAELPEGCERGLLANERGRRHVPKR